MLSVLIYFFSSLYGVKHLGHEAHHSPITSAEVKETWIWLSMDNFTFLIEITFNILCGYQLHFKTKRVSAVKIFRKEKTR
jgi:hypothetical protein